MSEFEEGKYESSSPSQFGTAIAFFLIGASAGAITALLLARKNGRQMRKALARRYEDAKDGLADLSDYAEDALGEVRDRASGFADRASGFAKDAKDAVGTARSTISDRIDSLRR